MARRARQARRARRDLRWAWVWVVLSPIGFAGAMLLGEWTVDLLGYPAGADKVAPTWVAALVGVLVIVVGIAPGAAAILLGRSARRKGLPRGLIPAVVGLLVMLGWVAVTVAGLLGYTF